MNTISFERLVDSNNAIIILRLYCFKNSSFETWEREKQSISFNIQFVLLKVARKIGRVVISMTRIRLEDNETEIK